MNSLYIILPLIAVAAVFLLSRMRRAKANEPALEDQIGELLDQDLFTLMIQPVVDLHTGTVHTGEVLSRLRHPRWSGVSPEVFIRALESRGLQPRFDRYIFRKCCVWFKMTPEVAEIFDCISVNFSRETLSGENIVRDLVEIADSYGVSPSLLAIEITERESGTDSSQMIENLRQLKAAGFRIYLDDYGSGVTSVLDLMQYPLDVVKIDRSVLLAAHTEQGCSTFEALVSMAAQLGLDVVCEGIETEEQSEFVRGTGCHYGQGFRFFRPIAQENVLNCIRNSDYFRP